MTRIAAAQEPWFLFSFASLTDGYPVYDQMFSDMIDKYNEFLYVLLLWLRMDIMGVVNKN